MKRSEARESLRSNKSLKVSFDPDYPDIYFTSDFEVLITASLLGAKYALYFKLKHSNKIYGGFPLTQKQVDNFITRHFKEI
jgi:hypothetical protein